MYYRYFLILNIRINKGKSRNISPCRQTRNSRLIHLGTSFSRSPTRIYHFPKTSQPPHTCWLSYSVNDYTIVCKLVLRRRLPHGCCKSFELNSYMQSFISAPTRFWKVCNFTSCWSKTGVRTSPWLWQHTVVVKVSIELFYDV